MPKSVMIACGICKNKNYRVTKTKLDRLVLKKFCPYCNQHTEHKEEK